MAWWYKRDLKRVKLKKQCYERQHGICLYCGKKMMYEQATMDRVVPHAMGGTYSEDNTIVAHVRCNQIKADQLHKDYYRKLRQCNWLNLEKIKQICLTYA